MCRGEAKFRPVFRLSYPRCRICGLNVVYLRLNLPNIWVVITNITNYARFLKFFGLGDRCFNPVSVRKAPPETCKNDGKTRTGNSTPAFHAVSRGIDAHHVLLYLPLRRRSVFGGRGDGAAVGEYVVRGDLGDGDFLHALRLSYVGLRCLLPAGRMVLVGVFHRFFFGKCAAKVVPRWGRALLKASKPGISGFVRGFFLFFRWTAPRKWKPLQMLICRGFARFRGEWGIRTPGTVIPYVSLANQCTEKISAKIFLHYTASSKSL